MLQRSFAYITSMHSCTEFAKVATTDREDTISIFNRRVNTKSLTENSSTYSVLRSWVQDDPDRQPFQVRVNCWIKTSFFSLTHPIGQKRTCAHVRGSYCL